MLGEIDEYVPISPWDAYYSVYGGPVNFHKVNQSCAQHAQSINPDSTVAGCWAFTETKNNILIFTDMGTPSEKWVVHELGHAFSKAFRGGPSGIPTDIDELRPETFDPDEENYGFAYMYALRTQGTGSEDFADMFVGWVYGEWAVDNNTGAWTPDANMRASFMDYWMGIWLDPFN